MRLLLDTHALIWAAADPDRLPPLATRAITDPANDVLVSVATAWEVAIKRARGRLAFDDVSDHLLAAHGFGLQTIDLRHTAELALLPDHHGDPFDRMLVAQARVDDLVLVSLDPKIAAYDVECLWAD